MKKFILVFISLNYVLFAFGQNYNYDLQYMRMFFTVDPAVRYIDGQATLYFMPLADAGNLSLQLSSYLVVDSIVGSQGQLTFVHEADVINVNMPLHLNIVDSITVFYHGVPPEDLFGSFSVGSHSGEPVMWTLSEPYGAKNWYPVKDNLGDKIDSLDLVFSVPEGYNVASNGVIVADSSHEGRHIVHWKTRYPIAAYLVAFAVTNYEIYYEYANIGDTVEIPVQNFVYPEDYDYARNNTPGLVRTLEFFSGKFGIYPFWKEKYGQAQFEWGGGMEHQTITFLGDFSHSLMAHELAHQWFGNYITCASWHEIYLNEAFATYLEGLTAEAGIAPYSWNDWKAQKINRILQYGTTGSVYVDDTSSVERIFSLTLTYYKGAMFLHLIRWTIGDSAFFGAIRDYLNDPALAYGFATTQDLKKHFEKSCNCDLTYLFDQWLYGSGYPVYTITWWQSTEKTLHLDVKQETTDPASVAAFELDLPVLLTGEGKDTLVVLHNNTKEQAYDIDLDFIVEKVVFDPDKWLVASAVVKYASGNVKVYPTIFTDKVTVRLPVPGYVEYWEIYSLQGKQIMGKDNFYSDYFVINLDTLKSGIYLFKLKLKGQEPVLRKIIKL